MQQLKEFARYTRAVLTAAEMQAIELNASALGMPGPKLMENAGIAVADFVKKQFVSAKDIIILCGMGWKGGSGFSAARQLIKSRKVTVGIAGGKGEISFGPALQNLEAIERSKSGDVIYDVQSHSGAIEGKDLIIDAILGTGLKGKADADVASLISAVNDSNAKVVSIDIPSGLDAETGKSGLLVDADFTVTFHKPKSYLLGLKEAGKVVVEDIGIPIEAEIFAGPGDLELASRPRGLYSNKRDNGSVIVIAGSKDYHGSPVLASSAAQSTLASLRVGAGYAYAYVPKAIEQLVRGMSPNLVVRSLGTDYISDGDLKPLLVAMERVDCIVIGMGVGRDEATLKTIAKIIDSAIGMKKKIVIDSDAIYAVKYARGLNTDAILTPQDNEFRELSGSAPSKTGLAERFKAATSAATKLGATILLKGHDTVITDGRVAKIVRSESAALATMGTGDVLSGIIGGYAAVGATAFESAVAGAYLNARIGDLLYMEKGNHIIASDVVDKIPKLVKDFDENV